MFIQFPELPFDVLLSPLSIIDDGSLAASRAQLQLCQTPLELPIFLSKSSLSNLSDLSDSV